MQNTANQRSPMNAAPATAVNLDTIPCTFRYQGGKFKLDGPGTINFAPDGITLDGRVPGSRFRRSAVRITLAFIGILSIAIAAVVVQIAVGGEGESMHWASYGAVFVMMFTVLPGLYRLSDRLSGGNKNAAPVSFFIPLDEIAGVEPQPFLGTTTIAHRAPGKWIPSVVHVVSNHDAADIKTRFESLKNASNSRP